MPLIGKNADYFLRSTGPEVRTKRPGRGRAASSSMELFNGVWGLRHQQAICRCINICPACRDYYPLKMSKLNKKYLEVIRLDTYD